MSKPPQLPRCPVPLAEGEPTAASIPVLPPPQPLPGRETDGRFAKGNPGKPHGARSRVTIAIEALLDGQWEALTKVAIDLALRGETTALKLCLDRLSPVRRGSHIEIPDFPKINSPADLPKAHAAIVAAVASGCLTAEEAKPLSDLLTAYVNAFDVIETAAEVAEIKRVQKEGRRQ